MTFYPDRRIEPVFGKWRRPRTASDPAVSPGRDVTVGPAGRMVRPGYERHRGVGDGIRCQDSVPRGESTPDPEDETQSVCFESSTLFLPPYPTHPPGSRLQAPK